MKQSEWDKRVQRATELADRYSYAREVLSFYRQVLEFQRELSLELLSHSLAPPNTGSTLRGQLDVDAVSGYLPALVSLIRKKGTAALIAEAEELGRMSREQTRDMLEEFLRSPEPTPHSFFARVLLQPYAEQCAAAYPLQPEGSAGSVCPICGSLPQASVLHPEGEGGKRFLLCSFCLTEWEFRRILCPVCGEQDYQKLPRYSAEEVNAVRVEACDTCHSYLKSVDMTIDGLAAPMVDEIATAPLDLWAAEHGYKKIATNLMGF